MAGDTPAERGHNTVGLVVHAGRQMLPLGERLWAVPVAALWRDDAAAA
jgi:hypothetical protein